MAAIAATATPVAVEAATNKAAVINNDKTAKTVPGAVSRRAEMDPTPAGNSAQQLMRKHLRTHLVSS